MKKGLLFGIALPLLATCFVGGSSSNSAVETQNKKYTEADRDIKTGYLLRDSFSIYPQASSGWETKNMPRGINVSYADVKKTNTLNPTYIKKHFVSQTGEIVADINVTLGSDISKGYITLLGHKNNKEVKGVLISVENNLMYYVDSDGDKTYIGDITYDDTVGLRIIADASKGSASIEVNGAAIEDATNVSLNEDVEDLCAFQIGFGASDVGGFKLKSISIRKGFELYEDFSTVGFVSRLPTDYNVNTMSGVSVNCTVNDHTIQGDNNNLAALAFDDDESTYWEHNKAYTITTQVYFMITYPQTVGIDTLEIKFASYFKGMLQLTANSPAGTWDSFGDGTYSWYGFETTQENNYTFKVDIGEPKNLVTLALGFAIGSGDYNIASGDIKVSSFKAYCKHPKESNTNTFPTDWNAVLSKNTTAAIESINGDKAMKLTNSNGVNNCSVSKDINIDGNVTTEFNVCFQDAKNNNQIGLFNQNGDFIGIETNDEKYNLVESVAGVKKYTPIVNEDNALTGMTPRVWNRFILKYNDETQEVNVDYNGWNPIADVKINDAFKNSTWKKFSAATTKKQTAFSFDSVQVYETMPGSNVPDIIPCDTGDTIVTMQVCSLWREGTHTGWGILDNAELSDRETILGYYDEGTAAVSDWEVKIAREHGISNFMFCWYRNSNSVVKTSNYSDALWNGLFKSKFKNDINFSIMFENSSGSSINGMSDLVNNLMPYFIEVFFKNPNYQKTKDGKPILYVYAGDLLNSVGDANGDGSKNNQDVVFATNKMREMCVEAGLPGLYISTELRAPSSSNVTKLESFGYDSIFSYTWASGYYNVTDDFTFATAKSYIESQMAALNNMKIIPNISKQWDPMAWINSGFNPEGATYTYDLEHYREFALYVKNLISDYSIDDYGTKMVMLDNWNEYSEGHWLMPSYGTPAYKDGSIAYGYLDILREVFGIYEYSHVDYFPREDGYGVYDTWYPKAWDEPLSVYLELNGTPVDNSVAEDDYVDWEIGYDTLGGETVYVNEYSSNIEKTNANRIVLAKEVVATAKQRNEGLSITGAYGSVKLSASEVSKLDSNSRLEVVLNRNLNVSNAANALRKQNIEFNEVYSFDYSLKQCGVAANISATVSVNVTFDQTKMFILSNDTLTSISSLNLSSNCKLVFAE